MKKKGNSTLKKKSPDMVLHRTFHGTKALPTTTKGLAHKLRNLSVPIIDIRKDNSLLSLGLEDQGHGVWRINTNLKPTLYHCPIHAEGSKEEIPLKVDGDVKNPLGRTGSVGRKKAVTDNDLGGDTVVSSYSRKIFKKGATKVSPVLVDLTSDNEENVSVCESSTRVRDRKKRLSSVNSNGNVGKKVSRWAKDKNVEFRVETEVQSNPEVRTRSRRNQLTSTSPNENQVNKRGKMATLEGGRKDKNIVLPLGTNGVKRSPRVVKNIEPRLNSVLPRQRSPVKRIKSNVVQGGGPALRKKNDNPDSDSKAKKYGQRSLTPPAGNARKKRKGETCASLPSVNSIKSARVQMLQNKKRDGSRDTSTTSTLPTNLSKQGKTSHPWKKNASPLKPKKNSGSKKNIEDDKDFKVSSGMTARGKALPKLKLTRKHQNKLQMQWCEICGVELDSLDNKLEHEFRHREPRQLLVKLHRCHLNHPVVKLPMYVSREELAAIPDPQEDTSSPILSDDETRPCLAVDDVLNSDEENAYESYPSSDGESILGTEDPLGEGGTQGPAPPSGAPDFVVVCDMATSPFTTPERNMSVNLPKSVSSKERSKRKSQVKMRLWQDFPVTRSGRVIKVSEKTKEGMQQQIGCVRVLFSKREEEGSGARTQPTLEGDDVEENKHAKDDSVEHEHAEDNVQKKRQAEDGLVEQKHGDDDAMEEKHAEDGIMTQKHREDDVIKEKNADDDLMDQKHGEDDLIEEKLAEVGLMAQKHGGDDVIEEKNADDDLMDQKHGDDDVLDEKHTENDLMEEKHGDDDVIDEKHTENDLMEEKHGDDDVIDEKHTENDLMEEKHGEDDAVEDKNAEDEVEEELGEKESKDVGKTNSLEDDSVDVMKGDEDIVESKGGNSRKIDAQSPKRDVSPGVEWRPTEDSQAHEAGLEENNAMETEYNLLTDDGTTDSEVLQVVSGKLTGKENEVDTVCISTGDPADIGLLPVDSVLAPEPSGGTNDSLATEFLESSIISANEKGGYPEKTNELCYKENDKDEDFSSLGNNIAVGEKDKSLKKDEAIENELDSTPNITQNTSQEVEHDVCSEKPVHTLAPKKSMELQEEFGDTLEEKEGNLACKKSVEDQEDVSDVIEDISLSLCDEMDEQKAVSDSIQEGEVSEPDNLETVPEKQSALPMAEDKLGIGELLEDAADDNSKDIMLVDEGNDVLVGGALAENVEMQESEFIGVPSDIDISKFNMPNDQGLEDISDDEWTDISDKEMQHSPQFVNGNLGDVEMDEEGPASSIDNIGQEGAMDLEETEKDAGLPDSLCTGVVAGESLEEEMKDLESAEDAIMSENVMDEMVGVLSSKGNLGLGEGIGLATEPDMPEPVEDPEEGRIDEVIDTIQDDQVELAGKVNADEQVTVESESERLLAPDMLREEKIVDPVVENISEDIYKGDNNVLGDYTFTEEVPETTKLPVNGIELVAVVGSGGDQGDDVLCGERVEVAETSDSVFVGGCKGDPVHILKENGATVKNKICAASRNENAKK